MLNLLSSFVPTILAAVEYTQHFSQGLAYIGAGIAVFTGAGTAIGQGLAASKAVEAVSRQPEASGKITTTMLIGQAVAETTGLYGLIIAFILTAK